jgi:branched-chain amino acid transport system permease protein
MRFLVNTMVLASMYGILALGYVIVYRASRVINFAHGEFTMLGAYLLITVVSLTGLTGITGSIFSIAIVSLISVGLTFLIYLLLIRSSLGQPTFIIIMITVGLSIFLRGMMTFIWGSEPRYLGTVMNIPNKPLSFSGITIASLDAVLLITFFVLLAIIGLFFKYSKIGIQARAASENPLLAAQRGINIHALFGICWSMSIVIASIGGVLCGATNHLGPEVGFLGIKSIPVAIVGGLYSLAGVLPAAVIIALLENIVSTYFNPLIADVVPMVVLLAILIVRPWGIFGKEEEIERI